MEISSLLLFVGITAALAYVIGTLAVIRDLRRRLRENAEAFPQLQQKAWSEGFHKGRLRERNPPPIDAQVRAAYEMGVAHATEAFANRDRMLMRVGAVASAANAKKKIVPFEAEEQAVTTEPEAA